MFRRPPPPPPPPVVRDLRLPQRGTPLTDFEQTAGWTVSSTSGSTEFLKNMPRAIRGEYAGEIRFTPEHPGTHEVVLRPDTPWRANSLFNTLLLWVWDDGASAPSKENDHAIRLTGYDATESPVEFVLPYTPRPGWQMLHLRNNEGFPDWPIRLETLHWHLNAETAAPRVLYLESLTVYMESLTRVPRDIQFIRPHDYAPSFAPRRANSVLLDFPPEPAAFRPDPGTGRLVTRVERLGENRHRFRVQSEAGVLDYLVSAEPGAPTVQVSFNERPLPGLWRGFGVETGEVPPEPRFSRLEDNVLYLQYADGLRFRVSLHGRTLQIEAHSLAESFTALDMGHLGIDAPGEYTPVFFPFLRIGPGHRWPVLSVSEGDKRLFVSVLPDWWFSMAGHMDPPEAPAGRIPLGRMVYPERWNGSRNVFRERVYLTVSPSVREVLPRPSSHPALHLPASGRLVLPATEDLTGPADIDLLGIRPTDPAWRDDLLARGPLGEWLRLEDQHYLLKSARFSDLSLERVRDASPGASWLRLPHFGDRPPWAFTDFDARVLGAGTFAQTWAELGVLLQQTEAETGRPLLTRGGSEWFLAGLVTGFVPDFPGGFGELHPYLPHFALQNLVPFSSLHGLGSTREFRQAHDPAGREEAAVQRQIATQIAYGACGRLPAAEDPLLRERAKRVLTPLHRMFTANRVARVAYRHGDLLLDLPEAIETGALERSQLYLRLENGTEIWVNGDPFGNWRVRVADTLHELPPNGFIVRGDEFLLLHALNPDGFPHTASRAPGEVWLDSPASRHLFEGLSAQGSVRVLRGQRGQPTEIELSGPALGAIHLSPAVLGLESVGTLRATDATGGEVTGVTLQREEEKWVLHAPPELRALRVFPRPVGPETKFSP